MAPFDGSVFQQTTAPVKSFAEATGRERLAMLADALERPMPDGLQFDWATPTPMPECGTIGCGLGVARYLWPDTFIEGHVADVAERVFELSDKDTDELFFKCRGIRDDDSAEMARRIRSYLATGKVEYRSAGRAAR